MPATSNFFILKPPAYNPVFPRRIGRKRRIREAGERKRPTFLIHCDNKSTKEYLFEFNALSQNVDLKKTGSKPGVLNRQTKKPHLRRHFFFGPRRNFRRMAGT